MYIESIDYFITFDLMYYIAAGARSEARDICRAPIGIAVS